MALALACAEYGDGPPLLILHGLFGSGSNWKQVAGALADTHRVYVPDLRNHGASPGADSMDYGELAADVERLLGDRGLEAAAVIGHSMGGKAAMRLALEYPARVERLMVIDIAPVSYDDHFLAWAQGEMGPEMFSGLSALLPLAEQGVMGNGPFAAFSGALAHNSHFDWRANAPAIAANLHALSDFPEPPGARPWEGPALFVRGALSDFVRRAHRAAIRRLFPRARIVPVPAAGHWVHADQPAALIEIARAFLG